MKARFVFILKTGSRVDGITAELPQEEWQKRFDAVSNRPAEKILVNTEFNKDGKVVIGQIDMTSVSHWYLETF